MTDSEAMELIMNAPVAFGLKAQGKLETVRQMRKQGCGWPEVAKAIGWEVNAVRDHYMACLEVEMVQLREAAKHAQFEFIEVPSGMIARPTAPTLLVNEVERLQKALMAIDKEWDTLKKAIKVSGYRTITIGGELRVIPRS